MILLYLLQVRFMCFIGGFTLKLLYGWMLNLAKTSRCSEQPLSQFVTIDKRNKK